MASQPEPTAVVILAAGLGSRLGTAFQGKPKWLIDVTAEHTIAAQHLVGLDEAGSALRVVVTGAHAELVEAYRTERLTEGRSGFETRFNPNFSEWNNWYSLQLGLEALDELGWTGPTLVINGDLFCPSAWISDLAADVSNWADITLAVDTHRPLTDEAMKVELNDDGRVARIGKVGLSHPAGEYIGLSGLTTEGRATVLAALRRLGGLRTNDWYEGALQLVLDDGGDASVWPLPDAPWVEVDNEDDLAAARSIALATS